MYNKLKLLFRNNQEIRHRMHRWDARAKIPLGVVKLKKRKKWCVRYTSCLVSLHLGRIFSLLQEGTWVAAWHFAGFMRPLRMVPGPVHLSPPQLPPYVPVLPSRPRLRTFCRVAITRQSPLPFGPLMDARCVGTGVPVSSMGCDQIHTRVGRLLPRRKDTRPAL